jgi:hypothetical protein
MQLERYTAFPLRVRHLEQIDLRHGASNVQQSVDSAKSVERALDESLDRARLAQIERISQGFGACGFYRGRSLAEFVLLPRGQDNSFEVACQAYGSRPTNALACARDDSN